MSLKQSIVEDALKRVSFPISLFNLLHFLTLWACRQFFLQNPAILQTLSGESSGASVIQLNQLRAESKRLGF